MFVEVFAVPRTRASHRAVMERGERMRVTRQTFLVLALGANLSLAVQDYDQADRNTTRLAPGAFIDLPAPIRAELERRGCTVPQPFTARRPENVIQGRFTSRQQMDWAVLCSRQRMSSILIFRGGSTSDVAELATEPDITFLQTIDGKGTVGYSRGIAVTDGRSIRDLAGSSGAARPASIDHDGITDAFVKKGSVVWYWHQNRWLKFQGAD